MMPWFVWKGKNSLADFGLWINKLPPIVKAQERVQEVTIPGRPGVLTLLEGEDIYEPVLRKCVVIARNTLPFQLILDWLRGEGELVFSNEPDKTYYARIAAEVAFDRISNDMKQATIQFSCQPFKGSRYPSHDQVEIDTPGSITNPGDIASRPLIHLTGSGGNSTITIGSQSMQFKNVSGTIDVDCDAEIVTKNGTLWDKEVTGKFFRIPKGTSSVTQTGSLDIVIDPRWRWI